MGISSIVVSGVVTQEGKKSRNDVADKMRQLMERWEQGISPTNRRFSDRFITGEIHILIIFRVVETGEVWFVCLERNTTQDKVFSDGQDVTVLIGVVESAEKPEGFVPALVWFERINGLYRFPPRTLYASSLSGFITLKGMRYRELNISPVFRGSFAECNPDLNQLESEVVQGTAQVVNHVTSDCRDFGRKDVQRAHIKEWLASLRLCIEANRLKGCFSKRQDGRFEIIEVLLGPFNFYANQSDSVVGKHSLNRRI